MITTSSLRRTAVLVLAASMVAACGGDGGDDATPAPVDDDSGANDAASDAADDAEGTDAVGQFGSARFTIDGTTYEWQASCDAVRVVDGVTQPGAILQSAGLELTTGALMVFSMESDGTSWSIDISNGETGEAWTLGDPTVSESAGTYEASGDAFSTSDATPRPFELTVTCP